MIRYPRPARPNSSSQKRKSLMDLRPDRDVYKAARVARKLIKTQTLWPPLAIRREARRLRVEPSAVAHYVGQVARRKRYR